MKRWNPKYRWWIIAILLGTGLLLLLLFRHEMASGLMTAYRWIANREEVARVVNAFGRGAPLAFMALQVLQVVLAPVPGEATGFIGGYLFGTLGGFLYSSLALALGSWINFGIGRYLGKRFVRRWVPADKLDRFDHLLKRQGIIVLLILFIFPGFPKDYLCLFLGITAVPLKAFLLIATFGRMPGTLMLSLQGEFLFQKNYLFFAVVFGVTGVAAWLSIRYRDRIYRWMEKLNGKTDSSR
ncbi:TVP38/TMEM64 family protein [Desulfosarcina ovata]|uniref:TVP38/TMEM64 family protein n=1 Tax=Desulfosarcina ovata TaxID=83564 RepID=UPI001391B135|nr:TVP38/TMEM64 family protein [Desulfosarcina ovata]